ncbi:MAG: twin-arginine translocase TatA/TatE family subunit [Bacteroidales bacterium]|nr:twin-arginine translocase TatA/TatE family subunit [Candidatus Cacconaster caballi]
MGTLLFLGSIGWQEILVILLIVLLLFGGKKIPELMRGLGKGVKSFKQGMKEVEGDVEEIKNDIKKEVDKPEESK